MKTKNHKELVPDQHTGKAIDAESSVELVNDEEAKTFFNTVKARLENVNNWHQYAGTISAEFRLVDKTGVEVRRIAQKGDYFKIDIPGPGSAGGNGYDWVQIEEVETTSTANTDHFGFRVRPAQNPQNNKEDIAHFYSPESTSSFTVLRENNIVTVGIYDRNTKTNKDTHSMTDKIRDAVVGTAGLLSFSKIQWQHLADGLMSRG